MNLPEADHYMIFTRAGSGYKCYDIVPADDVEREAQRATGDGEAIVYIAPCYVFHGTSRMGCSFTCTEI